MPSPGKAAYSLLESVLAMFLMTFAFMVLAQLFHTSLNYSASLEHRAMATFLAESKMGEIRAWARTNFAQDWSAYDGVSAPADLHPSYTVTVRVADQELASPCRSLESLYPVGAVYPEPEPKLFRSSYKKVEVQVRWSPFPDDAVELVSLVGDSRPADIDVVITGPAGGTVGADAEVEFQVSAEIGGEAVPDVVFQWYVEPIAGYGSIAHVSRMGDRCTYANRVRLPSGDWEVMPGTARLVARTVFRGVEQLASVTVENSGP